MNPLIAISFLVCVVWAILQATKLLYRSSRYLVFGAIGLIGPTAKLICQVMQSVIQRLPASQQRKALDQRATVVGLLPGAPQETIEEKEIQLQRDKQELERKRIESLRKRAIAAGLDNLDAPEEEIAAAEAKIRAKQLKLEKEEWQRKQKEQEELREKVRKKWTQWWREKAVALGLAETTDLSVIRATLRFQERAAAVGLPANVDPDKLIYYEHTKTRQDYAVSIRLPPGSSWTEIISYERNVLGVDTTASENFQKLELAAMQELANRLKSEPFCFQCGCLPQKITQLNDSLNKVDFNVERGWPYLLALKERVNKVRDQINNQAHPVIESLLPKNT